MPAKKEPDAPETASDPVGNRATAGQLRELHARLRDHGITTDDAVYAYLGTVLDRDITTRKSLTPTEAARVIAELVEHPYRGMTPDRQAALRAPFPEANIGKLPRLTCRDCRQSNNKRCQAHQWVSHCRECGNSHSSATIHLDYVGHAEVTDRLLTVDPTWSWRPFTPEELSTIPPSMRDGLWGMVTVAGVTRPGVGFADGKNGGDAVKECISDLIRNAAMRFGVALDLWAKTDLQQHVDETPPESAAPPPNQQPVERVRQPQDAAPAVDPWANVAPADDLSGKSTEELLLIIDQLATQQGLTYADFTARWRTALGGLDVDDLDSVSADDIRAFIRSARAHIAQKEATTA